MLKVAIGFLSAVALLMVLGTMYRTAESPRAAKMPVTPEYGWSSPHAESLALDPAHPLVSWALKDKGRFKVEVEASSSVSYGVMYERDRADLWESPTPENIQRAKEVLSCEHRFTLQNTGECETDADGLALVMFDDRNASRTAVNAITALFTRSSAAAERASAPNRVTVKISRWTCLRNCRS